MTNAAMGPQADSAVPVPDPTAITTERVEQAKSDLRRDMGALRELLAARLAAIEQDRDVLHQELDRRIIVLNEADRETRAEIGAEVEHLRLLHEERFGAIAQQFQERDTRSDQDKKSSKEALDAALLAQKESVSQQNDANTTAATKSETSFTKQIDQIGTLIATLEKSLTDRITELKERIDRGEGGSVGVRESEADGRQRTAATTQIIGVVIAAMIVAVSLYAALHK